MDRRQSAAAPRLAPLQRGRALSSADGQVIQRVRKNPMASTGPRSFERGWGSPAANAPAPVYLASTGPRSFERGWSLVLHYTKAEHAASTGPRSFERGWEVAPTIAWRCSCFNGAALFRARMGCPWRFRVSILLRFNGAALFRARMAVPTGLATTPGSALQRGRALSSADRRSPGGCRPLTSWLASTGPRSFERGWSARWRLRG